MQMHKVHITVCQLILHVEQKTRDTQLKGRARGPFKGSAVCYLSSGDAHCHPDVSQLQGRGVIHAISSHGGNVSTTLEQADNVLA
jgi:hypothetical protein